MRTKKTCREARMVYCPFLVLGHDTTDCIVTQQGTGAHGQARHSQQLSTTRRSSAATRRATGCDTAGLRARASDARAHILAIVCRDTKFCFVAGGQQHGTVTRRCDTAPSEHDTTCSARDTAHSSRCMGFCVVIKFLYRNRGRRHDLRRAATWCPGHYDTAPSV